MLATMRAYCLASFFNGFMKNSYTIQYNDDRYL